VQTDFPKYKPEFLGKVKEMSGQQVKFDTLLQCQPPGVPRIRSAREDHAERARSGVSLRRCERIVLPDYPIDGRPHRKDFPASYLGDSVGRIEGDTLIVDTTNFNEDTWLTDNGAFHTAALKVTERFRRRGDDDRIHHHGDRPAVLAEPWNPKSQVMWITNVELEESPRCEDRDLEHIVDGSHHDNPR
jgi:hypothetical protein